MFLIFPMTLKVTYIVWDFKSFVQRVMSCHREKLNVCVFFHYQYLTFISKMNLIDTINIHQKQQENCYSDQAYSRVFFAPDSYFCGKISL